MVHFSKLLRTALLGGALCALMAAAASATTLGAGTITTDALRMREETNTDSRILMIVPSTEKVIILDTEADGWYKVSHKSVVGYMSSDYLKMDTEAEDVDLGYGMVFTENGATLNIRSGPGTEYDRVGLLGDEWVVKIIGISNNWYKITCNDKTGYVSSDYLVPTADPATRTTQSGSSSGSSGSSGSNIGESVGAPVPSNAALGAQIVEYAKKFLGVPYVYGANGPGSFDCSGFTKYVYAQFGYSLNRSATDQLANGVPVSKDQLAPGDLVFFRYNTTKPVSHVGIYIGGGQFIHASTNHYMVQINDLTTGHYNRVYVYARRIA